MAATNIISDEFYVQFSGVTVAHTTDFTLTVDKNTIDVSKLNPSLWQEKIAGKKSWNVSVNGLITRGVTSDYDYNELVNTMISSDDEATIIIKSDTSGDYYLSGNSIINNVTFSGAQDDKLTYSASFDGTGALAQTTV